MLKGLNKLETACPGISLLEFRCLRELRFVQQRDNGKPVINAYLKVACERDEMVVVASLSFQNVKQIRIQGLNPPDMYVPGFDVISIKDRGWEGINYEVLDYEEDRINFYAKDAEFVEVVRCSAT